MLRWLRLLLRVSRLATPPSLSPKSHRARRSGEPLGTLIGALLSSREERRVMLAYIRGCIAGFD